MECDDQKGGRAFGPEEWGHYFIIVLQVCWLRHCQISLHELKLCSSQLCD